MSFTKMPILISVYAFIIVLGNTFNQIIFDYITVFSKYDEQIGPSNLHSQLYYIVNNYFHSESAKFFTKMHL